MGAGASTPNYRVNYRLMMSILREDDPTLSEDDAFQIVDYAIRNNIDLNPIIESRRNAIEQERREIEQERLEERARIASSQTRRRAETIVHPLDARIIQPDGENVGGIHDLRYQLLQQIRGMRDSGGGGASMIRPASEV